MKIAAVALCLVVASADALRAQAADTASVPVRGPTVVACFHPVTQAQVDADPDLGTVLDDWQWHWSSAARSLRAHGVAAEARMADWVKLAIAGRLRLVRCPGVGYVLAAPGRGPKVLRDVMTDSDLVDAAARFFGRADLKLEGEGDAGHP
ncbi:MAG TPA: hypothetical protein VF092_31130 [Longimicrobium sp.]